MPVIRLNRSRLRLSSAEGSAQPEARFVEKRWNFSGESDM